MTVESVLKDCGLDQIFKVEDIQKMQIERFDPGNRIMSKGMIVNRLKIVYKGNIKIVGIDEDRTYLLEEMNAPVSVGDIELLGGQCSRVDVYALKRCEVLSIPTLLLRASYLDNVMFMRFLMDHIVKKYDADQKNNIGNTNISVNEKFYRYLIMHRTSDYNTVVLNENLCDIAGHLGVTYRHLSRIIKELEDGKIIERHGRKISILKSMLM